MLLTRHPLAILSSHANTFDRGDYDAMYFKRDILGDFVPEIAKFLRTRVRPFIHLKYEELVADPFGSLSRILEFIGLEMEDGCVEFGRQVHVTKTFGDPKIENHVRPVTDSLLAWVADYLGRPDRKRLADGVLDAVSDQDLTSFGYPRDEMWRPYMDLERDLSDSRPLGERLRGIGWCVFRALQRSAKRRPVKPAVILTSKLLNALSR